MIKTFKEKLILNLVEDLVLDEVMWALFLITTQNDNYKGKDS